MGVCSDLQGPQQLAAVLYPGDVKQLVDGPVGQLRPVLSVGLNGIQNLVLIFGAGHLTQEGGREVFSSPHPYLTRHELREPRHYASDTDIIQICYLVLKIIIIVIIHHIYIALFKVLKYA